jgi:type IV pilus assembly protein PilE
MADKKGNGRGCQPLRRRLSRGFTLTEVMIVVVIISILAAIATPAFLEHASKTRRKDGLTTLLRQAQLMERCFSRQHAYNNGACTAGYPLNSAEGYYAITLATTATTFTLTATPPGGGVQLKDTGCTTGITLTQIGARAPAACW